VDTELRNLIDFLEGQKARQAPHFPGIKCDKVLTFLGTTSLAGSQAALGVCPVLALEPANASRELRVTIRGPLPRRPSRGECLTVHLTNVAQYQGFQLKTRALSFTDGAAQLFDANDDEVVVKGAQLFTVHHSPYTMKFFEQIPFEEVQQLVARVRYAIVAVGEQANVSPRFVYHIEVRQGRPVLFHGDGLALKTYMNLKSNRRVTQLALDLDDCSGYQLHGDVEEFQPHQHSEAYAKICQGFAAGNWGKPSRTFKFTAEAWERVAPTAAMVKKRAVG
jgi:hypothetical protein